MNSAMLPFPGAWFLEPITPEVARQIVQQADEIFSFIGYESTAKYMSETLGIDVPVNRGLITKDVFDENTIGIICKLKYRVQNPADKGKFTPAPEDFEWYLLTFESSNEMVDDYSIVTLIIGLLKAIEMHLEGLTLGNAIEFVDNAIESLKDESLKRKLKDRLDELLDKLEKRKIKKEVKR